jgi:protein O-GlcNAc transferase
LPVLTRRGATFAGRVSASVLEAIGLTELVTTSAKSYVDVAIALAAKPNELSQIRQRLAASRQTAPLFDIALFTKNIERGYAAMYDRWLAGLPADHLDL